MTDRADLAALTAAWRHGSWPLGVHRAFVEGAKWWQFTANGATAFPSEQDAMEAEAVRRYGEPAAPAPTREQEDADVCHKCGHDDSCCVESIGHVGSGISLDTIGVGDDAQTLYTGDAVREMLDRAAQEECAWALRWTHAAGTGGIGDWRPTCLPAEVECIWPSNYAPPRHCPHCGKRTVQTADLFAVTREAPDAWHLAALRQLTVEEAREAVRRRLKNAESPASSEFHDHADLLDQLIAAARRAAIAECKDRGKRALCEHCDCWDDDHGRPCDWLLAALDEVEP